MHISVLCVKEIPHILEEFGLKVTDGASKTFPKYDKPQCNLSFKNKAGL